MMPLGTIQPARRRLKKIKTSKIHPRRDIAVIQVIPIRLWLNDEKRSPWLVQDFDLAEVSDFYLALNSVVPGPRNENFMLTDLVQSKAF